MGNENEGHLIGIYRSIANSDRMEFWVIWRKHLENKK